MSEEIEPAGTNDFTALVSVAPDLQDVEHSASDTGKINGSGVSVPVLLMARLRAQVEFYFSPQNLSRDTYLRSVLLSYGGVAAPLSVICNFPKVRELCSSAIGTENTSVSAGPALVMRSVSGSSVVSVSPDSVWISPIMSLPPLDPAVQQRIMQTSFTNRPIHTASAGPLRQQDSVQIQKSSQLRLRSTSPASSLTSSTEQTKERTTVIVRDVPSDWPVDQILAAFTFGDIIPKSARPDFGDIWYVLFASENDALIAASRSHNRQIDRKAIRARIKSEAPINSSVSSTSNLILKSGRGEASDADVTDTSRQGLVSTNSSNTDADQQPHHQPQQNHLQGHVLVGSPMSSSNDIAQNGSSNTTMQAHTLHYGQHITHPTQTTTVSVTQMPPGTHIAAYPYHHTAVYHGAPHHPTPGPPQGTAYVHHNPQYIYHNTSAAHHGHPSPVQHQSGLLPHPHSGHQPLPPRQHYHQYFHHHSTVGTGFTYMNAAGHRNYFGPKNQHQHHGSQPRNYDNGLVRTQDGSARSPAGNTDKKQAEVGKQNRKLKGHKKGNQVGTKLGSEADYKSRKSGESFSHDQKENETVDQVLRSNAFSSIDPHNKNVNNGGKVSGKGNFEGLSRLPPRYNLPNDLVTDSKENDTSSKEVKQTAAAFKNKKKFKQKNYSDDRRKGHLRDSSKQSYENEKDSNKYNKIDLFGVDQFPALIPKQEPNGVFSISVEAAGFSGYADALRKKNKHKSTTMATNLVATSDIPPAPNEKELHEAKVSASNLEQDVQEREVSNVSDTFSVSQQMVLVSKSTEENIKQMSTNFTEPETIAVGALTGTKSSTSFITNVSSDITKKYNNSKDKETILCNNLGPNVPILEERSSPKSAVSQLVSIINRSEPTPREASQNILEKKELGNEDGSGAFAKVTSVDAILNAPTTSVWVNKPSFIDVVRKQA